MAIKLEEIEELQAVVSPVLAALALKAVTGQHRATDEAVWGDVQKEYEVEATRIFEGFKAALNGEEGAVEYPDTSALEELFKALTEGADADDPFDLSQV